MHVRILEQCTSEKQEPELKILGFSDELLQTNRMKTILTQTHSEEHKVFLVVLPDTVVHPRTVVVHLFDAPLTNTGKTNSDTIINASYVFRLDSVGIIYTEKVSPYFLAILKVAQ